jgi:hypothetical protein
MDPFELERIADRALKALPAPRAPHTLLPRVMSAIAALRPAPRTWFTWPFAWQLASICALVTLAVGTASLVTATQSIVDTQTTALVKQSSAISLVIGSVAAVGEAAHTAWQTVQPIVCGLLLFLMVMSTACVVFGIALGRVALGGAFQR